MARAGGGPARVEQLTARDGAESGPAGGFDGFLERRDGRLPLLGGGGGGPFGFRKTSRRLQDDGQVVLIARLLQPEPGRRRVAERAAERDRLSERDRRLLRLLRVAQVSPRQRTRVGQAQFGIPRHARRL